MDSESLFERIESYLDGTMNAVERDALESEMANNPDVMRQVEGHRKANLAIRHRLYQERKASLLDLDKSIDQTPIVRRLVWRKWAAAAIALLLIGCSAYLFLDRAYAHEQLATRQFVELPPEEFRSTSSDGSGMQSFFTEAQRAFENGDYDQARMRYLEIQRSDSMQKELAEWNLLMCYLASEPSGPRIEILLNRIADDPNHPYSEDARALRKKMSGKLFQWIN